MKSDPDDLHDMMYLGVTRANLFSDEAPSASNGTKSVPSQSRDAQNMEYPAWPVQDHNYKIC